MTFMEHLQATRILQTAKDGGFFEGTDELSVEELGVQVIGISGEGILATLRGAIHEAPVQDTADRPR